MRPSWRSVNATVVNSISTWRNEIFSFSRSRERIKREMWRVMELKALSFAIRHTISRKLGEKRGTECFTQAFLCVPAAAIRGTRREAKKRLRRHTCWKIWVKEVVQSKIFIYFTLFQSKDSLSIISCYCWNRIFTGSTQKSNSNAESLHFKKRKIFKYFYIVYLVFFTCLYTF